MTKRMTILLAFLLFWMVRLGLEVRDDAVDELTVTHNWERIMHQQELRQYYVAWEQCNDQLEGDTQ